MPYTRGRGERAANVRRALYLVDRYRGIVLSLRPDIRRNDPRDEISCGGYAGYAESALRFFNKSRS